MTHSSEPLVHMGHGSGGRITHELIRDIFVRRFANRTLAELGDAAVLDPVPGPLAFTTDAFVVSPLFFAGGDIGALAVNGTLNDLAAAFAVPLYLSASFILEEGLPLAHLERVADSMAHAARESGVCIVAGDTKVVERGHGDGVFVTTSGVGRLRAQPPTGLGSLVEGDVVIVSGPVGDHGAVIAAHRGGLELGDLKSDCASVLPLTDAIERAGIRPRVLRDPTRGGLATVLAEFVEDRPLSVVVTEAQVPIRPATRTVCEILGLDPLYLACEGRLVVVVERGQAERAVRAMRDARGGEQSAIIGEVSATGARPVVLRTRYGGSRVYDMLASEQLPRIC